MWRKRLEIKDEKERIIKDYKKAKERTMNRAVRLLAAKPRSVKELRERLLEKEWTNGAIVDEVLKKLEEYKYLDDNQFAEGFAAAKLRQKPLGKRRLKQTLSQKKLDKETVEQALEKIYENHLAGSGSALTNCRGNRARAAEGGALARSRWALTAVGGPQLG